LQVKNKKNCLNYTWNRKAVTTIIRFKLW